MPVTIRDVAKRAGVSITTVSRALNGYDDVNAETRTKIFQIAKELNYQPNRVAQNLVTKRLNTLGFFVLERTTFFQPFVFEVVSGMVDYATNADLDVLLFGAQSLREGMQPFQMCAQRGVGGAAIMGLRVDNPIIEEIQGYDFPTILVDIPIQGARTTYVTSDNQLGSRQAITHLVELGHRQIGFINGHSGAWVSVERLKGYRDSLAEHGLTYQDDYVYNGDFSEESGSLGARCLLEKHPQLTAIYVASDLMAKGVIEELNVMGLRVPQDISVIGFDDMIFTSYMSPKLTTIRQHKYQIGERVAIELIKMLDNEKYHPEPGFLDTSLVVRESTGRVR